MLRAPIPWHLLAPYEWIAARAASDEPADNQLQEAVTTKLKLVRSGRDVPLAKLLKDALDHLSQAGGQVSQEDLEAAIGTKIAGDAELEHALQNHERIAFR